MNLHHTIFDLQIKERRHAIGFNILRKQAYPSGESRVSMRFKTIEETDNRTELELIKSGIVTIRLWNHKKDNIEWKLVSQPCKAHKRYNKVYNPQP